VIPAALLKFIPGGPQLAMSGLLILGLGIAGTGIWFKARSVYLKQGRAEVQVVLDRAISEHNAAAMAASDAYRRLEQALNTRIQEAQDALLKERAASTQVVAALNRARTERNGLRDQINAYAAGSGRAGEDSVAACRDRAQALGSLLDEALRVGEESAGDGEQCEAGVRALLKAWPSATAASAP
jgi:hypothetical protein